MSRSLAILFLLTISAFPALASEQFKDVPKDHWAASAVQKVADAGILKGYPDNTFRGDKPVTRFELAAVLKQFVEYMEQSRKPVDLPDVDEKKGSNLPQPVVTMRREAFYPDAGASTGGRVGAKSPPTHTHSRGDRKNWGRDSVAFLRDGGFLADGSALLQKDGNKPVTADDLAQALASVAARLIEKQVPSDHEQKPRQSSGATR